MNSRNEVQRILAVVFAFAMIASLVFPAYAEERAGEVTSIPSSSTELATTASHDAVVYENGNNPVSNAGVFFDWRALADDFVLNLDYVISDAHFAFACGDTTNCPDIEPLQYFIFADSAGLPGAIIAQGTATNVMVMPLGDPANLEFEFWFDFEDEVPLQAGITYWFGITYDGSFVILDPEPLWLISDVVTGNPAAFTPIGGPITSWSSFGEIDFWFQLTSGDVVGGESLSIDTTALLLAGAQANSVWILSALAAIGGIAFGALYITTRRN